MGRVEAIKFCKTTVVPALGGGFFFNPENGRLVQLLQFYGISLLYVIPLSICLADHHISPSTKIGYSASVGIIFLCLQLVNVRLNSILDGEDKNDTESDIQEDECQHRIESEHSGSETAVNDCAASIVDGSILDAITDESDYDNDEPCDPIEIPFPDISERSNISELSHQVNDGSVTSAINSLTTDVHANSDTSEEDGPPAAERNGENKNDIANTDEDWDDAGRMEMIAVADVNDGSSPIALFAQPFVVQDLNMDVRQSIGVRRSGDGSSPTFDIETGDLEAKCDDVNSVHNNDIDHDIGDGDITSLANQLCIQCNRQRPQCSCTSRVQFENDWRDRFGRDNSRGQGLLTSSTNLADSICIDGRSISPSQSRTFEFSAARNLPSRSSLSSQSSHRRFRSVFGDDDDELDDDFAALNPLNRSSDHHITCRACDIKLDPVALGCDKCGTPVGMDEDEMLRLACEMSMSDSGQDTALTQDNPETASAASSATTATSADSGPSQSSEGEILCISPSTLPEQDIIPHIHKRPPMPTRHPPHGNPPQPPPRPSRPSVPSAEPGVVRVASIRRNLQGHLGLTIVKDSNSESIFLAHVSPAAANAGLVRGDRVISIDSMECTGRSLSSILEQLDSQQYHVTFKVVFDPHGWQACTVSGAKIEHNRTQDRMWTFGPVDNRQVDLVADVKRITHDLVDHMKEPLKLIYVDFEPQFGLGFDMSTTTLESVLSIDSDGDITTENIREFKISNLSPRLLRAGLVNGDYLHSIDGQQIANFSAVDVEAKFNVKCKLGILSHNEFKERPNSVRIADHLTSPVFSIPQNFDISNVSTEHTIAIVPENRDGINFDGIIDGITMEPVQQNTIHFDSEKDAAELEAGLHKKLTAEEAERLLTAPPCPAGTFLVRCSVSNEKMCSYLSVRYGQRVVHFELLFLPSGWVQLIDLDGVESPKFGDVCALVDYFRSNPLSRYATVGDSEPFLRQLFHGDDRSEMCDTLSIFSHPLQSEESPNVATLSGTASGPFRRAPHSAASPRHWLSYTDPDNVYDNVESLGLSASFNRSRRGSSHPPSLVDGPTLIRLRPFNNLARADDIYLRPNHPPPIPPRSYNLTDIAVDDGEGQDNARHVRLDRNRMYRCRGHRHPLADASFRNWPWTCDGCLHRFRSPERLREPRWHCTRGCDFDFCNTCMDLYVQLDNSTRSSFEDSETEDYNIDGLRSMLSSRFDPPAPVVSLRSTTRNAAQQRYSYVDLSGERHYYHITEDEVDDTYASPHSLRRGSVTRLFFDSQESLHGSTNEYSAPLRNIVLFGVSISIPFDRLMLQRIFDRNTMPRLQILTVAVLASATTLIGFEVSQLIPFSANLVLWLIVATCQYALLKAPYPDAGTSLMNERSAGFMRSGYFILFSVGVLLIDNAGKDHGSVFYKINWAELATSEEVKGALIVITLCLPLIWLFGHLPVWWRTLLHHICEQLDIVFLGGGGSKSMAASVTRLALLAVFMSILYGVTVGLARSDYDAKWSVLRSGALQGSCTSLAYICSRLPADPRVWHNVVRNTFQGSKRTSEMAASIQLLKRRLAWEPLIAILYGVCMFAIHATRVYEIRSTILRIVLIAVTVCVGVLLHYVYPELRNPRPWRILKSPVIACKDELEVKPKAMHKLYKISNTIEAHLLYPLCIGCAIDRDAASILDKFGIHWGSLILAICTFKLLRLSLSNRSYIWVALLLALCTSEFDETGASEGLLVDWYVASILVSKVSEFQKKIGFSFTYRAPWNHRDVLGSGLHAFLYPLQVPHTTVVFFQAVVATIISAPIYPVMGSPLFLVSYFRPIKFFERRFTTTRLDSEDDSSTKKYTLGSTANNLNSVFYIQLQRELEANLTSDIDNGLLGEVSTGDVMLLTNIDNNMSAFLHIIDVGHGYTSFQLRGLEFAGTFCQAQELAAIDAEEKTTTYKLCDRPFFQTGLLGQVLPLRTMFLLRWKTWHQIKEKYAVKGYSISLLSANNLMPDFDSRQRLRKFIIQALAYYIIRHPKLKIWLEQNSTKRAIARVNDDFIEVGAHLLHGNTRIALDGDTIPGRRLQARKSGASLTFKSFSQIYDSWISHCKEDAGGACSVTTEGNDENGERIRKFIFYCSVIIRRLLAAFNHKSSYCVNDKRRGGAEDWLEIFFQGFHRLFQGRVDFEKIQCEWATQLEGLDDLLVKSTRMALRLFQDYLSDPAGVTEFEDITECFDDYDGTGPMRSVICAETDPRWEEAIMNGEPSLLSFRHLIDDSSYNGNFYVVVVTRRKQTFKVYQINSESVRGLWAAQQQELLFFKNPDNERGSIQNAKCVLRNLVSQSADHPVGYATHISEIVHSYSGSPWQKGPFASLWSRLQSIRIWTVKQLKKTSSTPPSQNPFTTPRRKFISKVLSPTRSAVPHRGQTGNLSDVESLRTAETSFCSERNQDSLERTVVSPMFDI